MVDAERLGRILTRIRRDVTGIRGMAQAPELIADEVRLGAVKYGFVTAIEGCIRAAQHVIASEGIGMAESNADAIRLLGRHGVVEAATAESVAVAVGFRNVLVHEYAEVDDARVVANVALVGDLDLFARALARWASIAQE